MFNQMEHRRKLQVRVYLLAFITYFGFYVSREPYSLVKSTLLKTWAPFNGADGIILLGILDTVFLASYAVGIFLAGFLCERYDALYVLVTGCFGSGVTTILYGMADFWDIHNYWYFVVLRILNGLSEAAGWPTLIKMLDFHFSSEAQRDFLLTAFGSCKFLGIIGGSIISSVGLTLNKWGYCFLACGLVIIAIGIVDIFFLPRLPPGQHVHREREPILGDHQGDPNDDHLGDASDGDTSGDDEGELQEDEGNVVLTALRLPGILDYAFNLLFVKLGVYVFYYWLPVWFVTLVLEGKTVTYVDACWYTAAWALGGVCGTISIGISVQLTRLYATFDAVSCVTSGVLIMSIYKYTSSLYTTLWIFLLLLVSIGCFQMAPYSLASACMPSVVNSAIHHQDKNPKSKLVGMATGIIDGVGSVGAIFGPLTGAVVLQYTPFGWSLVFIIVAVSMVLAGLVLARQVLQRDARRLCNPD